MDEHREENYEDKSIDELAELSASKSDPIATEVLAEKLSKLPEEEIKKLPHPLQSMADDARRPKETDI